MKPKKENINGLSPFSMAASAVVPKDTMSILNTGLKVVLVGAFLWAGNKFALQPFLAQRKLNQAETEIDTEAGRIAQQFKTLFDGFGIVSDSDFKKINLQVNSSNKDEVYRIYRALTGRNLSEDISSHVSAGNVAQAAKIETYNSNPVGIFKIDSNGKIQFNVGAGSKVVAATGKKSFWAYADPIGIALYDADSNTYKDLIAWYKNSKEPKNVAKVTRVSTTVVPGKTYTVTAVQEQPFSGVAPREGWVGVFLKFVNTKKTFAVVKIGNAYVDARDLAVISLKGIGSLSNSKLL